MTINWKPTTKIETDVITGQEKDIDIIIEDRDFMLLQQLKENNELLRALTRKL
jgi:hypothetical protein